MKLPLSVPAITSQHFYAIPIAIIGSEPRLKPWIYNEFIQIYSCRNKEDEHVDIRLYNKNCDQFRYEPLYDAIISPKKLVSRRNVIETYKSFLDNNQYIYDFVDKFYISSSGFKDHYIHDLLVYGYNNEKQVFYVYSYYGSKLKEYEIPYAEYIKAYDSEYQETRLHHTTLYRKKDDEFRIDIKKIGNYILDYIEGINTYNRESLHEVCLYKPKFGINVYDDIKYMLEYERDRNAKIDIPGIYCVYDHKRLMRERVWYLNKCTELVCPDSLLEDFQAVEKAGQTFAMLAVKLARENFNNLHDFENMMKRIDILKEMEEKTLSEYYEYNRNVFESV